MITASLPLADEFHAFVTKMKFHAPSKNHKPHTAIISLLIATALGAGAGWFMAGLISAQKFSWLCLALIPLWLLLEIFFELAAVALGSSTKFSRALAITGLLSGFYVAWFLNN